MPWLCAQSVVTALHPARFQGQKCACLSRRSFVAGLVGGSLSISPRSARSQTLVARQYHPQPVGSHLHVYLTKLWDAVRTETGGQLDVTVYPQNNGAIIADPKILKQVQSGGLEFFVLNGNILSQAHRSTDVQGIPFAFTSSEQVTSLTDGSLGDLMRDGLARAGVYLIPFGCLENGFKHITCVSKPIRTAADLEGFRMRTPGGKLFVEFYKALGADPRIVGFNRLFQALAGGQVDGQENPLVIAEENRLYESAGISV
jgi:TRAP-type transport system periplasmic protein